MKALIFTLVSLLVFQTVGAQNIDLSGIPKNVTKVIIHNKLNKEQNFKLIGETLLTNGYRIEKTDKDFYTITTDPQRGEKLNISSVLSFVARDSSIMVSGTFYINDLSLVPDNSMIINKGMKGSPVREAFNQMVYFALKLSDLSQMEFLP